MQTRYLWHLAIFVGILILLNFFFQLHISIIGSLVLTVVLTLAFNFFQKR